MLATGRLSYAGYEASEPIAYDGPAIHFVTRGTAVRGGQPLVTGKHWGEDAIITSDALRDTRPAAALTYCETATVTRDDILQCLEGCEQSEAAVRRAAMALTGARPAWPEALAWPLLSRMAQRHLLQSASLQHLPCAAESWRSISTND